MAAPEVPSIKHLRIRREVSEGRYEPAIVLSNIVRGEAPKFLLDPAEFFRRTHVTESMRTLIIKTLMGMLGKTILELRGRSYVMHSKLIILPSLYGGGKSHSLAVLYHLLEVIRKSRGAEEARGIIEILDREIADFIYKNWNELKAIGIKTVVVDCGSREFAPVPEDGKEVKTLWGYIAQQLGRYSAIASYDKNVSPPKEALKEVLDNSGAVVLIDEIARYYTRTRELGRSVINDFLMNLTEVLTTEEVRRCIVILTLPYDVEKGVVEEAHADAVKPEVLKRIVDRVGIGNTIAVVSTADLPSILRKRIFDEDEEKLREYGRKLADRLFRSASEVAREFIRKRGGVDWVRGELEKTYPFHPETIRVLELLHTHLSRYLQATRNPIRMASEAVLAIVRGAYDWMGYIPYLVMPFHIPVILEGVLAEAFPLSSPEFTVFREILERDVVHPIKGEGEEIRLGDNIKEKISVEIHIPSFMVTAYIWLRSLAGGGLAANIDIYPSTEDVTWAIMDLGVVGNRDWVDVSRILEILHGKLAYLTEYSGRWLFRRIPFLDQLIERYAGEILPNVVHDELVAYLDSLRERGRSSYSIDVLKDVQYIFIRYGEEARLPDDLDATKPAVVIFAREAADDEVEKVLERNNIVVLRPDTAREISKEDLSSRPDLNKYRTYWEALIEVMKRLKACERISDEVIQKEYMEAIRGAEEVFAFLKNKREAYKKEYDELRSFLLPRVYHAVVLKRAGNLKAVEGLTIRSEAPLAYAIEVVLQSSNYLKKRLEGKELEEVIKTYLGVDIREKKDGISVSDIWSFFLTSSKVEELPIIPFKALLEAVYDMVRSLDYAVKVDDKIYWKNVYEDRNAASGVLSIHHRDVGEEAVESLKRILPRLYQNAKIEYWDHILDEWLEKQRPREGSRIAVLTPSGEVKTVEELKKEYNWRETLKDSILFYEELKVEVSLEPLQEAAQGRERVFMLKITPKTYSGRVRVKIDAQKLDISEREFESELPVEKKFTVKMPETVIGETFEIEAIVYSEKGEILEKIRKLFELRIGIPPPGPTQAIRQRTWMNKKSVLKLAGEGKPSYIYGVRTANIGNLVKLTRLVPAESSKLGLSIEVSKIEKADSAKVALEVEDLPVDKASIIQSPAISLAKLGKEAKTSITVGFDKPVKVGDIKIEEFPEDVEFDVEYEVG